MRGRSLFGEQAPRRGFELRRRAEHLSVVASREQAAVVLFVELFAAFTFPLEQPPDVDLARGQAHRRLEKVGGGRSC